MGPHVCHPPSPLARAYPQDILPWRRCQRKRGTVQSPAAGLQQMLMFLLRLLQPEQGSRRGQRAEKYIFRWWEAPQSSFFSLHFASVWCWPQGTIPKLHLKPRSGDVPGRKSTVPLPEEWALCAQTDPYTHIGYIPEEGKNTSVCLFPVAVTTRHRHPSCPLKPWFGVR